MKNSKRYDGEQLMRKAFLVLVEEMDKNENKYLYSAQLMNQALLQLLETKDLDYITVTEITKKVGVHRSTFYLHYDNVYELFEERVENLNKEFVNWFLNEKADAIAQKKLFLITDEYLEPYLAFVQKNKRVLNLIHQKPQLFGVEKAYIKMQQQIFYPVILGFVSDEKEAEYKLEYYTKGVLGIVNKWTKNNCDLEIKELISIIKDCVGYTQK